MDKAPGGRTLILGGYGGIGSALARHLAQAGSPPVVAGRDEEKLRQIADETGGDCVPADAGDFADVDACVARAVETFGPITGIANCVGSLLLKPAHLTSSEEWVATVRTNLTSAFATVRAAGLHMGRTGGSVVLVSSAAARLGLANHEAIAAAKAGIIGLAQSAAATYSCKGIRVNVVAPGLVETPLTSRITRSDSARDASLRMHARGRLGRPEDVARSIAFLLDPGNDWITGQVLGVDGGLARVRSA